MLNDAPFLAGHSTKDANSNSIRISVLFFTVITSLLYLLYKVLMTSHATISGNSIKFFNNFKPLYYPYHQKQTLKYNLLHNYLGYNVTCSGKRYMSSLIKSKHYSIYIPMTKSSNSYVIRN